MAKLKAHGRVELLRGVREKSTPEQADLQGPGLARVVWERRTVSLQSDGVVLQKEDVRWSDGQTSSGGWKVKGKVKDWPSTGKSVGLLARRLVAHSGEKGREVMEQQALRVAAVRASWEKAGFEVKVGVGGAAN